MRKGALRWRLEDISDLHHIVEGLADAVQALFHPTIMNHRKVRVIGALFRKKWEVAGHVEV